MGKGADCICTVHTDCAGAAHAEIQDLHWDVSFAGSGIGAIVGEEEFGVFLAVSSFVHTE